ncbi:MFS transporter [Paraburkholderia aspalathi]|uniref:MFS transporter n=1 Tax=Paraburkholderia aspalathi TaxID=1324617 RepID=UPI003C98E17B
MNESPRVVNLTMLLDHGKLTKAHVLVIVLCAFVGLLDGADTQSIGVAAPFIAKGLGLKISSFGPVFASSQLGAAIGALTFGSLADRVGRKTMLIASVLIIAAFTAATISVDTIQALVIVRFFAGLGLGGATPCFLSLTSDYSPTKYRGTIATVVWSSYPLGAALGSFTNAFLLSSVGWRAIFILGSALPVFVAFLILFFLPESIQYLASNGGNQARIEGLLMRLGHNFRGANVRFTVEGRKFEGASIRQVFSDGRAVPTILLCMVFFFAFATTNITVMWTPTLLHTNGFTPAETAIVLTFFNVGAFFSMAAAGRLVDRFGSFLVLFPAFIVASASLGALGLSSTIAVGCVLGTMLGAAIGVGGAGAVAVASLIFPAAVRSTGIGCGMSSARLGQFVAPIIIGLLLASAISTFRIFSTAALFPALASVFVVLLSHQRRRRDTVTIDDASEVLGKRAP